MDPGIFLRPARPGSGLRGTPHGNQGQLRRRRRLRAGLHAGAGRHRAVAGGRAVQSGIRLLHDEVHRLGHRPRQGHGGPLQWHRGRPRRQPRLRAQRSLQRHRHAPSASRSFDLQRRQGLDREPGADRRLLCRDHRRQEARRGRQAGADHAQALSGNPVGAVDLGGAPGKRAAGRRQGQQDRRQAEQYPRREEPEGARRHAPESRCPHHLAGRAQGRSGGDVAQRQ